jgi:succinyl-CoA synthetase alpha subunit
VGENPAKPVFSNITFADVLMSIHVRSERRLRIVGVNHWNVIEPQQTIGFFERRAQAVGSCDVVARAQ